MHGSFIEEEQREKLKIHRICGACEKILKITFFRTIEDSDPPKKNSEKDGDGSILILILIFF